MKMHGRIYATGKRKEAVAKVWIKPGSGSLTVNGVSLDEFLGGREALKLRVKWPLMLTKQEGNFDIEVKVLGGGFAAQADAIKHGISKALVEYAPEFRAILKPAGLLTRDAREVERKKYGKKKARKSPQFSKR
ncbi:MAG: 30S ribosomal protein S9 [Epsilonproteobacteria bacterium]|nr:30S ribosomal protein S9 [Campylobacterota bacterium]